MNRQIFHLAQSGVLRLGPLSHLGLLVALCGNIQADGWRERERAFYQLRDDNASGSAAVLMAAQILSQYEFARTLHFVLFTRPSYSAAIPPGPASRAAISSGSGQP